MSEIKWGAVQINGESDSAIVGKVYRVPCGVPNAATFAPPFRSHLQHATLHG